MVLLCAGIACAERMVLNDGLLEQDGVMFLRREYVDWVGMGKTVSAFRLRKSFWDSSRLDSGCYHLFFRVDR